MSSNRVCAYNSVVASKDRLRKKSYVKGHMAATIQLQKVTPSGGRGSSNVNVAEELDTRCTNYQKRVAVQVRVRSWTIQAPRRNTYV